MSECLGCAYRKEIHWDCHVRCIADFSKAGGEPKRRSWNGCGVFPIYFDEAIVEECPSRSDTMDHPRENHDSPMWDIIELIASGGRL